ncbi:hypothetical protein V6N12_007878 [Hibiscus sabdariffa]|uniref:Uncharacterized protein n=1 Tax=Hibiscus sabdariffa TaxID=183260 RepID=A0ABR2F320_9ROSI
MVGRYCCSPAESRNDAWEGQDAFVILAGGRDLSGYDFPHIESVTCEDNMDEYQPGSVDGLGTEHRIEAGIIVGQAQYGVYGGGVSCNSSAANQYIVFSGRVICVELQHPVVICPGWLSCKSEPA